MSRCVPNWDLHEEDATAWGQPRPSVLGPDIPSVDSEVAELTWENGQLSLHGLGQTRMNSKQTATVGTLESLMNQAVPISGCKPSFADIVPWFNTSQVAAPSGAMMMDALVPCAAAAAAAASDDPRRQAVWLLADSVGGGTGGCGCCSTRVGSCSGDVMLRPVEGSSKRMRCRGGCGEWGDHLSASGSATFSHHVTTTTTTTLDACEPDREFDNATSEGSHENTQSGKAGGGRAADSITDEHDSDYSRSQKTKRRIGKSSLSTKRSRAASIHNQSERKRRDKINQKMKTLQKLVPNSSKTDKASVLDEVLDYLKQLQAQVQLMSKMHMMAPAPTMPMMLPLALQQQQQQQQQQLQMSMMASPMLGLGLAGMPGIFPGDMTAAALGVGVAPVPAFFHPFMPLPPWDGTLGARFTPTAASPSPAMPDPLSAFLAGQSPPNLDIQAMTLDAYSRLAAMYHHHQQQQQQAQNPNN